MNFHYPLLIDGGLSTEMENMGYDLNHKLWTARFIESDPFALQKVHTAYLQAGAGCISTFSYQATIPGYINLGYTENEARQFIIESVNIARRAITEYMLDNPGQDRPLLAASIGPYGAYLADGSEYKGNYGTSDRELIDFHLKKIKILDNSGADILAFETIPSFQEAKIIAELLIGVQTPSWVSFSCKDDHRINDGTSITQCATLFADHPRVFAIGVNCTSPSYISQLIKNIRSSCGGKKVLAYPNSGEIYNPDTKTWKGLKEPGVLTSMTEQWIKEGLDMVGGCCRIGANDIHKMSEVVKRAGKGS